MNENMKFSQSIFGLLFLLGLSDLMMGSTYAKEIKKTTTEGLLKQLIDSREDRLNKIQASLFAEEVNASHLGKELKELIQLYKDHLQQLETSQKLMDDNPLLKEISLLLARLETGKYVVQNQMQAKQYYGLISAIESIFEKLENPVSSFVDIEMPAPSSAIVVPLKKLQGEKIPYHLTASKIKKQEEADELPPSTSAHFKLASLVPEEPELEKR